jgi:serine/threonine protein kinase
VLLLLLQLLSSMDHPNIIKYYDSFLDSEGALCIATTYCEGEQLQLAGQQTGLPCIEEGERQSPVSTVGHTLQEAATLCRWICP